MQNGEHSESRGCRSPQPFCISSRRPLHPPAIRPSSKKGTQTSLIEKFLYPKYGPGQLWEHAADLIRNQGGEILLGWRATRLFVEGDTITAVEAVSDSGLRRRFEADYVFSTMPGRELIDAMDTPIPAEVREVSDGLQYRDFITVGLGRRADRARADGGRLKDNWIYIRSRMYWLGGCRFFNNSSPYMVADQTRPGLGSSNSAIRPTPCGKWRMRI